MCDRDRRNRYWAKDTAADKIKIIPLGLKTNAEIREAVKVDSPLGLHLFKSGDRTLKAWMKEDKVFSWKMRSAFAKDESARKEASEKAKKAAKQTPLKRPALGGFNLHKFVKAANRVAEQGPPLDPKGAVQRNPSLAGEISNVTAEEGPDESESTSDESLPNTPPGYYTSDEEEAMRLKRPGEFAAHCSKPSPIS